MTQTIIITGTSNGFGNDAAKTLSIVIQRMLNPSPNAQAQRVRLTQMRERMY
jgi:hypothetical protein